MKEAMKVLIDEIHQGLSGETGDNSSLRGGEKGGRKGEKKKKGRGRRKGRRKGKEEGGERRREGILKKNNVQNNFHCKHWQPRVAMLTVVCVNR